MIGGGLIYCSRRWLVGCLRVLVLCLQCTALDVELLCSIVLVFRPL